MKPETNKFYVEYNSIAGKTIEKILEIFGANKSIYFTGGVSLCLTIALIFSLQGVLIIMGVTGISMYLHLLLDRKYKEK